MFCSVNNQCNRILKEIYKCEIAVEITESQTECKAAEMEIIVKNKDFHVYLCRNEGKGMAD